MAYRSYKAGETVLVRARVLADCNNLFASSALAQVLIEDFPDGSFVSRAVAPFSEIASFDDVELLRRPVTIDPTTAKR